MLRIVKMKYDNMLKLTNYLREKNYFQREEEDIQITFNDLEFIEPAGAVLLLTTMDRIKKLEYDYTIEPIDGLTQDAISYGTNMGIFQKLGVSSAPSFKSGGTYLAPTKIVLDELYEKLSISNITVEEYFEQIAEKIVGKALDIAESSMEVNELFVYVVREIIRNIFDHSGSTHFYYALQCYRNTSKVEVVIADVGVGFKATVPFDVEEKWFDKDTDENAIKKALIPGLSAHTNHAYAPEDYKNSGYGLALVSRIIQKTGGLFSIASGLKSITFTSNSTATSDCDVNGTVIRMRINLDKLSDISFDELLKDAQKEAKEKGYSDTPSTASKTLKSKVLK
ncbi:hypothetical protein [Lysinibacillus sp. NPDC093688]|uniref:hypothetical protein n=1 Tax=Lysinibacillus sp. NPDC093688 TaxID=3390577 RepID=UPI003D024C1A